LIHVGEKHFKKFTDEVIAENIMEVYKHVL